MVYRLALQRMSSSFEVTIKVYIVDVADRVSLRVKRLRPAFDTFNMRHLLDNTH